jgi:transmembrane sensor
MDRQLQARLETDPLIQAATEWFVELSSDSVSGERVAEWQDWMGVETHRQAFEHVESFWNLDVRTNAVRWPTDAVVAADDYTGDETVSAWRANSAVASPQPRSRIVRQLAPWTLAASVCVVAILSWMRDSGVSVETATGETRTMTLADGSKVTAGGRTELVARLGTKSRDITLTQGEAFFEVADDKERPFTVRTGDTSITAIGTAFNVRHDGARTVIAVAEGSVRVDGPTPAQLRAGEQLSLGAAEAHESRIQVDAGSVAGWREGRLQYFDEPLSMVIADLARHSSRRITVEDAAIGQLQVTGVVQEQNIDGWLSSLEATFGIEAVREPDGVVRLRAR